MDGRNKTKTNQMSQIAEYLNLIPKSIPNSRKIVEGIINNVQLSLNKLSQEEKNEIIKRRVICAGCPFSSTNAKMSKEYKEVYNKSYESKRMDEHCSLCGCTIKTKTASLLSNCGAETWNLNNPENNIPLKWDKFEKDGK